MNSMTSMVAPEAALFTSVAFAGVSPAATRASLRPQLPTRRHSVRAAADGPSAARPARPAAPVAPSPPQPSSTAVKTPPAPSSSETSSKTVSTVSMEYQRQMAKEMVTYFQEKKFEDISQRGKVFGWTRQNEIGNGRWVMFGLMVGLLTEYATGVNFPSQIAIVLENLGIID